MQVALDDPSAQIDHLGQLLLDRVYTQAEEQRRAGPPRKR